jgi:hypothetical protein
LFLTPFWRLKSVLSSRDVEKSQSKKLMHSPNVNSLLKISLGLILFTIISSALVYAETVTVNVDGISYDIDYTATGMTVSGVEADLDFVSLIFTVDVTNSPGILDITFDRSFFDSIFEGTDDDFIILADGDEPTSTETEITSQSRTLNIELPAGTEEVEIIGSSFDNPMSISTDDSDADKAAADKAAADDTPKTQCGPGTILKNGACVLDERCGPGTILKDGTCIVESTPKSPNTSVSGLGKDLGMGLIAAIVIAGVIAIILGIVAKADKSSN